MKGIFTPHQWKSWRLKKKADQYSMWSVVTMLCSLGSLFILPGVMEKVWAYAVALAFLGAAAFLRRKYKDLAAKDSKLGLDKKA